MNDIKKLSDEFAKAMQIGLAQEESRRAIAVKIVKYISDSVDQEDVAAMLFNKEYIPLGQTAEFAVPGKLKVYWHEPGSYAPRTQMVQKTFTIPTAMISAHLEYELGQLESGRYGSMQDQIAAAKEALLGAINAKAFNTLVGAVATTDKNYGTCDSMLTYNALNSALNYVEDQVGGATAIVGRRNVLYQMLNWGSTGSADTGIMSDAQKEAIFKGGKIPTYRGVPVIGLPQWRDGFGKLTIDQDEIMIVGKDAGHYVVTQELRSQDAIDVDSLYWHIHLYMRVGFSVFFKERLFRLHITQ